MKILLTLIMCSYVQGACLQPYEWPIQFEDMYDCMQAGYEASQKKMKELGRIEVNQHQIYIRFTCVPAATT
jgi:hypothetical protein